MNAAIENALVSADLAEVKGEVARLSHAQRELLTRATLRLAEGDAGAILAVESVLNLTVTMPAYRLADATKKVAALAKKAEKRGLPVPAIEVVGEETREDDSVWVTARLLGAAPVLNGWRCLATIVPNTISGETSNIVCTASGVDFVDAWRTSAIRCDHCTLNRRRALTFVLEHEDGRVVQVGKTCLNEYLGTDALAAWFVWSSLRELHSGLGSGDYDLVAHAEWLADRAAAATRRDTTPRKRPSLEIFLAACAADVRVHGYRKSNRYEGIMGTGARVLAALRTAEHEPVTDADEQTARECLAWLDDQIASNPREAEYMNSLLNACACARTKGVLALDANTIASALRACGRTEDATKNEAVPGAVVREDLTVDVTPAWDLGWAWKCEDPSGRCVMVKGRTPLRSGATVRVTGRVEQISEYRGTVQTVIVFRALA
jgi:hypothetical protein